MKSKTEHIIIALVITWFVYLAFLSTGFFDEKEIEIEPVDYSPHYVIPDYEDSGGKG